jgi:hypothetical protein
MRLENWVYTIPLRLRLLFHRNRQYKELDEELRDHIDRQIEENLARGMGAKAARLAALQAFGNPVALREQTHDTWSWSGMELLLNDVRFGARALLRTPGFASIAILVMTLGIGANVALFTIVRSVLLNPLPYVDPDRLVRLYEQISVSGQSTRYGINAAGMYAEWKEHNQTLDGMAIAGSTDYNLSTSGEQLPEVVHGGNLSWNTLPLLGVRPVLGRTFTADDDKPSANPTVLLSWGLWKRRFGGDSAILNKTILLDAEPHTVIGVMPPFFSFSGPSFTSLSAPVVQLWTPIYQEQKPDLMKMLDGHAFEVIGRLKPGVTETQAVADLTVITRRIHDQHPEMPFIGFAANGRPLLDSIVGPMKTPLYALLSATGCVLLIACLNVANLLVARAAARRKEQAIRTALGGEQAAPAARASDGESSYLLCWRRTRIPFCRGRAALVCQCPARRASRGFDRRRWYCRCLHLRSCRPLRGIRRSHLIILDAWRSGSPGAARVVTRSERRGCADASSLGPSVT